MRAWLACFAVVALLPLGAGEKKTVEVIPGRGFDIGMGKNRPKTFEVEGGVVGLMIDGRGRPLQLPADENQRIKKLGEWLKAFGLPVPE